MAIKALEQDSCDDCIRRKELLEHLYDCKSQSEGITQAVIVAVESYVEQMPSVRPARRKGKWITTRTFQHDGEFYCDKCKCDSPQNERWDFCPNCGADMRKEEKDEPDTEKN